MLRIKENVDLKELEKFGFEESDYKYFREAGEELSKNEFIKASWYLMIYKYNSDEESRTIIKWDCLHGKNGNPENDIQDLIQAGLVEKVEE